MTGATRGSGRVRPVRRRERTKTASSALDLACAAAHNLATFRTILDLESENLAALTEGRRVPPDVLEKLRRIVRTSRAISETAAHFIALARNADGTRQQRPNTRRAPTLRSIVEAVQARFAARAKERGVRLLFAPVPDRALHGDGDLVRWALRMLVEAALELTDRRELQISCAMDGPASVSVRVCESGEAPEGCGETGFSMGLGLLREAVRDEGGSLETSQEPSGATATLRLALEASATNGKRRSDGGRR